MTLNVSLWRKNVCGALDILADETFQRGNWFGKGRYIDSPSDQYNSLFSDFEFEEFVDSPLVDLNVRQRAAGRRLIDLLRAFEKVVDLELPPEVVIDHPKWVEIRHAARQFLHLLDCSD
ncbi:MAG: hypothetical protein JSR91_26760 [Proteobacteria bacterium]|nr:hypothetical protein [Pseudomonadota bacterium]